MASTSVRQGRTCSQMPRSIKENFSRLLLAVKCLHALTLPETIPYRFLTAPVNSIWPWAFNFGRLIMLSKSSILLVIRTFLPYLRFLFKETTGTPSFSSRRSNPQPAATCRAVPKAGLSPTNGKPPASLTMFATAFTKSGLVFTHEPARSFSRRLGFSKTLSPGLTASCILPKQQEKAVLIFSSSDTPYPAHL